MEYTPKNPEGQPFDENCLGVALDEDPEHCQQIPVPPRTPLCHPKFHQRSTEEQEKLLRKLRKEGKRTEKRMDEAEKLKREHEIKLLEIKHSNELNMMDLRDHVAAERLAASRAFALELVGALVPLTIATGHGIMEMHKMEMQVRREKLVAETTIAKESPEYAMERVKMRAASWSLTNE